MIKELIPISYGRKLKTKEISVGMCITSRYYKGFSNYNPENAVIVVGERERDENKKINA